jgi:hypothetical protein
MDRLTRRIAGRLEAIKSAGVLADYLVAWHGTRGRLAPAVTVWRCADASEDIVKAQLDEALCGLVSPRQISIFLG